MAKRGDYPAELLRPIWPSRLAALAGNSVEDQILDRRLEKLLLLLEHFKIGPDSENSYLQLSFDLACKHVKGFSVVAKPRKVGRPKTRKADAKFELCSAIAQLKQGGLSVRSACRTLTTKRSSKWYGKNPGTLANIWRDTKHEIDRFESQNALSRLGSGWSEEKFHELREIIGTRVQRKSLRE